MKKIKPISLEEATKDFKKVIDTVNRHQVAIISAPDRQYAIIDERTYEGLKEAYIELMTRIGKTVISENIEALKELAK